MMGEGSPPSTKDEVSTTLAQLVSHFNQAVHKVEENPPYFDSVLGEPLTESPVDRFIIDRLDSLRSNSLFEWIIGYKTTVHRLLRTPGNNMLPVLQNYELILSKLLDKVQLADRSEPTTNETGEQISMTTALVSSDLLFVFNHSLSLSDYIRGNVLIPTLLRVQHHINCALLLSKENVAAYNLSDFIPCCVSLLPFSSAHLDAPNIDPYLVDTTGSNIFDDVCFVPPKVEHGFDYDDFISLRSVSWTETTLKGSTLFTEIGCRAAEQAWKSLAAWLGSSNVGNNQQRENDDNNDEKHNVVANDCSFVLRFLGIAQVAQLAQSRFFHHDYGEHSPDTVTEVYLGRRIIKKSKTLEEKVHRADPSVVHTFLTFVRLLGSQDYMQTSKLVPLLIPCCLELIDSTTSALAALGSSALSHLIRVLDREDATWRNFLNDICSKLEDASTVHRKGPAVLAIGRAQYMVLRQARNKGKIHVSFCKQWFLALHHAAIQSTNNCSWEILVGGIIPILNEMAKCSDAPGVEIGRLGLSALLPLVGGEFVDIKTQVAATAGLINLMVASHPIMPHHGGKIICHLLASSSGRLAADWKDIQSLREIVRHAAAVCLVVCGARGYKVLDAIESERDNYQKPFLEAVEQVRNLAVTLSRNEMEPSHVL